MTHYIVGAGGHARVIADILVAAGHSAPVHITDTELIDAYDEAAGDKVIVGVGDNAVRARIVAGILSAHPTCAFGTAIHPSAVVASGVSLGAGTVIMAGAVINAPTTIGAHVIINTRSSVDHDGALADFSSIAPGVALGGNVTIGRGAALGVGASVAHRCEIGEHTVVGTGSAVVKSLPSFSVCYGVPARVIRAREAGDKYL